VAKGSYHKGGTSPFEEVWVEKEPQTVSPIPGDVARSAQRISYELQKAREGRYINNAWYSYLDRVDLERVVGYIVRRVA